MLDDWQRPITPKSLALWSLSVAHPEPLRAATLIERTAIFAIEPAAMRVALARLTRDHLAQQIARGVYALGPAAAAIHAKARAWSRVEHSIRDWRGTWIVVLVDHLGRTERRQVQARERALRISGFAPTEAGAWVRPDNLKRNIDDLAGELRELGLDEQAMMFASCVVLARDDNVFRTLWPVRQIEEAYSYWLSEMRASVQRIAELPDAEAARETFLLGQSVIRAINSDPLLPGELIDVSLRREMIASMVRYNELALGLWSQLS